MPRVSTFGVSWNAPPEDRTKPSSSRVSSNRRAVGRASPAAVATSVRDMLRWSASKQARTSMHFLINVPGYAPLITHLFREGAEYLDSDVVFGTKEELVVRFEQREPGETPEGGTSAEPWVEARYDFVLQRQS